MQKLKSPPRTTKVGVMDDTEGTKHGGGGMGRVILPCAISCVVQVSVYDHRDGLKKTVRISMFSSNRLCFSIKIKQGGKSLNFDSLKSKIENTNVLLYSSNGFLLSR